MTEFQRPHPYHALSLPQGICTSYSFSLYIVYITDIHTYLHSMYSFSVIHVNIKHIFLNKHPSMHFLKAMKRFGHILKIRFLMYSIF